MVYNILYIKFSILLTNWENQRTKVEYEKSLLYKRIVFVFINTFNSLFIIAFLKPYVSYFGECVQSENEPLEGIDCFTELSKQMSSIFVFQLLTGAKKIVVPYILIKINKWVLKKKAKQIAEYKWQQVDFLIEKETDLLKYDETIRIEGTLSDMISLIIQFSFLALFTITFSLGFVFAFLANILDI